MPRKGFRQGLEIVAALGLGAMPVLANGAEPPKVDYALSLSPVRKDVDYDTVAAKDVARCAIQAQTIDGHSGWIVNDGDGRALRIFLDSNGDNKVDRWSYFKDGVEVYRDIDSNGNGKVDQHRWLNLGGSRWALDTDENGQIDEWKYISAEEVTAELVAALRDRDEARFQQMLLSTAELNGLGLDEAKAKELADRLEKASANFRQVASRQKSLTKDTQWVQFSASRPGLVMTSKNDSPGVLVYENVVAMTDTRGQASTVHIGTLIQVGDRWRAVGPPVPAGESLAELTTSSFFYPASLTSGALGAANAEGPSKEIQDLLTKLEELDAAGNKAAGTKAMETIHAQRAEILLQLVNASTAPEDRASWLRQLADMMSAAVQSGEYPGGMDRLKSLRDQLANSDKQLAAYVAFRYVMADYVLAMQGQNPDYAKIQDNWLKSLEEFVKQFPEADDAADAMLQLATTQEYSGNDQEARRWYGEIARRFEGAPSATKARGALTRLDSEGKKLELTLKTIDGRPLDLQSLRGKVVLLHYWASWSDLCRAELSQLRDLNAKYAKQGFVIVGISLDGNRRDLDAFLKQSRLPWPQVYEEGGLDGRLANSMGILSLPTMILIDKDGTVLDRGIHISELDGVLGKKLK
jgi:peroxiredoxin/TolA-binding protein